jgi:hypothetical protein
MSELAGWQQDNAQYLSAAVAWLRARLERRATQEPVSTTLTPPRRKEEPRSFWQQFVKRPPAEPGSKSALVLAARAPSTGEQVERTSSDLVAPMSQMHPPPALVILGQRLGLSPFEQDVLLLCAAMELDTGMAALCARAQGDPNRPYATFALALTLFDEPSWDVLSPERPLRYWRLIEINQPAGLPLTVSPLRADERIVNYVKGLNYLDDRLAHLLAPVDVQSGTPDLPLSHRDMVETALRRLKQAETGRSLPVIQLLGADASTKQLVAWEVTNSIGLRLYRLSAGLLPAQPGDIETLARLWQRESLLLPLALYIDASAAATETPNPGQGSPVNRLLERIEGAVFLDTREAWSGLNKSTLAIDVAKPTSAEQAAAWGSALGPTAGQGPALLAGQFDLGLTAIRQIAHEVLSETAADQRSLEDRLWEACLASTRPRLDALAQRLEPKATWDDIVLPAAQQSLLQQIAEQVAQRTTVYEKWGFGQKMTRGLGISALFAGESGTGKTMAAEVIANHLRLGLYRIDLSAVVSKYIGETEKNLRRLFDAAENGGAILFFDEADALFGKRSEVKDSHDRYANIEINYLLQRMEAYRGLAILATNMKSALDSAFLRRLRFVMDFRFPAVTERKAIWQKVFPPGVPKGELDFDRLARLNLTGGHIHNIALNAAFRAAHAGTSVTMPLILEAARAEFRKLERPINEMDFRWAGKTGAVA